MPRKSLDLPVSEFHGKSIGKGKQTYSIESDLGGMKNACTVGL